MQASTNQRLAVALARAHRWRALLEEGAYATIGELAPRSAWTIPTSRGSCA